MPMNDNRFVQKTAKVFSYLPLYTAIITTLTLLIILFGVPFISRGW